MTKSQRILVISYSYAPVIDPRSFRWTSVAEELVRRGHRVTVVSAWYPGSAPEEQRNGVRVIRTGGALSQRVRAALLRKDRLTTAAVAHVQTAPDSKTTGLLARVTRWLHDQTWKKVYWPDHAALWYGPAVRAARRVLETGEIDCLVTVSHPFTGQVIGRKLHHLFPSVRWVIDLGDPYCFNTEIPPNNLLLYRQRNYRVEQEIFEAADAASVTTHGTRAKYGELFPKAAKKISVIPPLISTTGVDIKASPYFEPNGRIRFLYTGTLYRAIRNPSYMLKLVEQVQALLTEREVELHFMGAINDCREIFAPYLERERPRVVLHGVMKRVEVSSAMRSADMLINIANDNPYQLPSKVVDYAWSGRPIANIARRTDDGCDQFFRAYPAYVSIIEHPGGPTAEQVEGLAGFVRTRKPDVAPSALESFLAPYQISAVVDAYESLILGTQTTLKPDSHTAHRTETQVP